MWRRVHLHRAYLVHRAHLQSRGVDALARNISAGSPHGGQAVGGKAIVANDKVVFMALGTFFGLMFLLFGIQIYVRCIWRRIRTEVVEQEDESEEMTRTDIYIREIGAGRRNWRRRLNHYFDERSDSSSPAQHIPVGLDKSVLEFLPTFVFGRDTASRDGIVCAVCLEEFVDGERGRLLPKCSHCFHLQCIDMWFLSNSSCPLCRCEVSLPSPDTISSPLLQNTNTQTCPDFSPDRSEQQQREAQPVVSELRDPVLPEDCPPVSSSLPDAESASIVGAHDSNNVLYLERGLSLSRRAAAIPLEMSDDQCISETEEDQQTTSIEQPDEAKLMITRGSSSASPSPGSQRPYSPSGSILCLEYQPELHLSTSAAGTPRVLDEDTATTSSSIMSIGSPCHARQRSYLAVEIIGEYQLDASGAMSQVIDSPHTSTKVASSQPDK